MTFALGKESGIANAGKFGAETVACVTGSTLCMNPFRTRPSRRGRAWTAAPGSRSLEETRADEAPSGARGTRVWGARALPEAARSPPRCPAGQTRGWARGEGTVGWGRRGARARAGGRGAGRGAAHPQAPAPLAPARLLGGAGFASSPAPPARRRHSLTVWDTFSSWLSHWHKISDMVRPRPQPAGRETRPAGSRPPSPRATCCQGSVSRGRGAAEPERGAQETLRCPLLAG